MRPALSHLFALFLLFSVAPDLPAGDWQTLFDGKSLAGWKSNDEKPNCFTVEDGAIKVSGGRAHLFYMGTDGVASFKDFEFKAKVKTTPGSNSGIYFHTEFQPSGWPTKGYECQVNATHKDRRKTGSLYAIVDVMDQAPNTDGEWFDYEIAVQGRKITIKINGKACVEYTEPDHAERPENMKGRFLGAGSFALQAHDPKSTTFYKDIRVRTLP
ncbi:MAG TPA: DUF1080 domain-containing protein [Verrucomicrobiae bacterium]|nr:DUF1080 domain-containing protein [Verrucomicrobiae bacterium]